MRRLRSTAHDVTSHEVVVSWRRGVVVSSRLLSEMQAGLLSARGHRRPAEDCLRNRLRNCPT